jgi:hypothetical protein
VLALNIFNANLGPRIRDDFPDEVFVHGYNDAKRNFDGRKLRDILEELPKKLALCARRICTACSQKNSK